MKLRNRIGLGCLLVLCLAVLGLGLAVSHTSACGAAPAANGAGAATMRAAVHRCYGSPDVIRIEVIARPALADDAVLVKVHAASVNPLDWHYLRGTPYLVRLDSGLGAPRDMRLGVDFAGTVEAVGRHVTRYQPGDEVFGGADGAFGEYVTVRETHAVALKPANVSFEQAAAVPIAALTALQALRDKGRIQAGQQVLINGASGGVGTFAVQIAKAFGAQVTGVCGTRNVQLVRSLGADQVIDYSREDFTRGTRRYDVIVDNVGSHSLAEFRRVLQPHGILVMVGGSGKGNWLQPLMAPLGALIQARFVSQTLAPMLAHLDAADLAVLAELMKTGKVTPSIDRHYPLAEIAEAIRYVEAGHARGKVVIDVD